MNDRNIAAALAGARLDGKTIVPPQGWPPLNEAQAESIRDAAFAALGSAVAGYKIGATSPEAQKIMGCDKPFYGAMPANRIMPGGSAFTLPEGTLGVECEFAFLIGEDQKVGQDGFDAASIAGIVESCHPALEIIGRRTRGTGFAPVLEAIADFAFNTAFVHGDPIDDWRNIGLAGTPVVGTVDGVETNRGSGSLVLGNPLNALAWLANRLAASGKALKAGEYVSTGTCLGVVPARQGTEVTGIFGDFSTVTVKLT